jgi:hypothetical protein
MAGLALAVGTVVAPSAANAVDPGVTPYFAPPFASQCVVHYYGEGVAPDLTALPDDPLCVDYAKRDITLDNGGALRFVLAEPARFAVVAGKCAYWQQDHWSVQLSRGQVPLIRWDGSYWYDLGAGEGGARLTGLTIAGQPATLARAAQFVAPYSPVLAAYFLAYANGGDGAAVVAGFPFNPFCVR